MKAMILAAGLGTRLKPWTLEHPKALVPVKGVPMLERVICSLREQGFDEIVVNVHHFGEQIIEFLSSRDFGVATYISDEREELLDTGGGLVKASPLFGEEPVLVHNVDILSDADLGGLMDIHLSSGRDGTLLVSDRESSRKLIFGRDMELRGWHHLGEGRYRPESYMGAHDDREFAFSGIYVAGHAMREEMKKMFGERKFPIMDYLLSERVNSTLAGVVQPGLRLIDIGKPDTLQQANLL